MPVLQPILVDGHVHLYDCFDRVAFLDGALANFRHWSQQVFAGHADTFVLAFSESSGDHAFADLRNLAAGSARIGNWSVELTDEPGALRAYCAQGELLLLAGRQIISAEKLELLALATTQRFDDGLPLHELIARVQDSDAITVLPWGFGKWWGRRGRLIDRVIAGQTPAPLYLGDNAGRPACLPRPRQFDRSPRPLLPGSDPLPLATEAGRAGRCGFALQGSLNRQQAAQYLRMHLNNAGTNGNPDIQAYMQTETTWRFLRNQLALRRSTRSGTSRNE